MIMERGYQPVIIFAFSKKECEGLALQMSKLDFNSEKEKELVDSVFMNAIDSLSGLFYFINLFYYLIFIVFIRLINFILFY